MLALAILSPQPRAEERAPRLGDFVGRQLAGSRFVMRINVDGVFELSEVGGGVRVTGVYSYIPGRLTLLDPRNDAAGLSFPMRCRVTQPSPDELRFDSLDEGCRPLAGQVFRLPPG